MQVSGVTAQETKDQFLQLLVTQMQHQDPLDPIKQDQFLSQLAQFSSLEGIENLNSTMQQQVNMQESNLRFQELVQAATVVGRGVQYTVEHEGGETELMHGTVSGVSQVDGKIQLMIDDQLVAWDSIVSIEQPEAVPVDQIGANANLDDALDGLLPTDSVPATTRKLSIPYVPL